MYIYLIINILTISFPLLRSFEDKIAYASKWKYLLPAIFITGFFFIIWDHLFTKAGVWGFNNNYILGLYILSLPLEEWLFFLSVPFACVFIYEVVKYFIKADPLIKISPFIIFVLIIILIVGALLHTDKIYTTLTFSFTAVFLIVHWMLFKNNIFGIFFISYIFHLIPFFVINGLLTSLPVVHYNNAENLGIRLFTIPVEDAVYSFLLLLMNITIYEFLMLKRKSKIKEPKVEEAR
ncbi:MAG: lycopene cyclase domain-containing protein [Bacteroidota bacterium]|nr:lycopene cyclase domain-containing protein [Bacteroidota bacterium]